jgi:hypothetical protein
MQKAGLRQTLQLPEQNVGGEISLVVGHTGIRSELQKEANQTDILVSGSRIERGLVVITLSVYIESGLHEIANSLEVPATYRNMEKRVTVASPRVKIDCSVISAARYQISFLGVIE